VLIVDEILGVGDAKFQEKCYSKIQSMREAGVCILFVSHSTDVIQRNCESALLLEGGNLVKYGPADAVVATYHDLLYGSHQADSIRDATPEKDTLEKENIESEKQLDKFLANMGEPFYPHFLYYNPNERRLGNGEADIVDFLVTADDNLYFNVLAGYEKLTIYLKVKFYRTVEVPRIGWALTSSEAIVIAGSNTVMKNIPFSTAQGGETWIYAITIEPKLCGGQYFFNFGIGDHDGESWLFLDERRAVAHLSVADSGKASGFFQIPSCFEVVRPPNK
jgi:lipopolysaccharide transport system ATP-binding protein